MDKSIRGSFSERRYIQERYRYNNYDLLRIISTIAVILIHSNFHYFCDRYSTPLLSVNYTVESFVNIITRFSVPVFVMLSGGFNLSNEKNENVNKIVDI